MIISCPSCEKKFEVSENLIPEKGRLLSCGFCNQTWFYNKNNQNKIKLTDTIVSVDKKDDKLPKKPNSKKNEQKNQSINKISKNKDSEIVKYEPQSKFTFVKFFSYIIVLIITFVGLIIILDTFKSLLYDLFPNLEFFLFSLYETLKDIELFIKDLI
tara:strand:- start:6 stop:476 length:471 start_codon:yes stop_codon:yes gene_type:complete